MRLQTIVDSPLGLSLALLLCLVVPRGLARKIGFALADHLSRDRQSALVRAVRANQAVVRGLPSGDPELDDAVMQVLRCAAAGYVDLFRGIARGPSALRSLCVPDADLMSIIETEMRRKGGLLLVGAHTSNFDALLMTLDDRGFSGQALAYADPTQVYLLQNAIRRRFGLDISPISVPALVRAARRLRAGGLVLTGVDRPDPSGELLTFFGRPARLPIGHARLALLTGASLLVGGMLAQGDGLYKAVALDIVRPSGLSCESASPKGLAQRIINCLEEFIRRHPDEWLMFYPVWPDIAAEP